METLTTNPTLSPMRPLPAPIPPGGPTVHEAVAKLTTGQPIPDDEDVRCEL